MNSLIFSLFAASFAALSNLCFRKSSSANSENNSCLYLIFFYSSSFILSFALDPFIFRDSLSLLMLGIGIGVGLLNMALMVLTSKALKIGPSGLTFAFQNSSAVFPGMILFLLFGTEYGFSYSYTQLVGILLVIYGLFLGSKKETSNAISSTWLIYAIACLCVQILALTLIQARCLYFETPALTHSSLASREDVCFMLGQFGSAFLIQGVYFFYQKRGWFKTEAFYGVLGGGANFLSTCLLLLATKWALPFEKGILFPCFAVGAIVLSNTWANKLYGEKFNFLSNATCACGIIMSLIDVQA